MKEEKEKLWKEKLERKFNLVQKDAQIQDARISQENLKFQLQEKQSKIQSLEKEIEILRQMRAGQDQRADVNMAENHGVMEDLRQTLILETENFKSEIREREKIIEDLTLIIQELENKMTEVEKETQEKIERVAYGHAEEVQRLSRQLSEVETARVHLSQHVKALETQIEVLNSEKEKFNLTGEMQMNEINRLHSSRGEADAPNLAHSYSSSSKFNMMNERVDNLKANYQTEELEFLRKEKEFRNNEQLLKAEI